MVHLGTLASLLAMICPKVLNDEKWSLQIQIELGGGAGTRGTEATVTQAGENASSAEVGSASENTAVLANKTHRG